VDTPAGALRAGVDRLVIGRSLTKGDPAANYSRILDEIRGVLTASD
jgi:orotidine-5'-phosphate decarboxylase